MADSDDAASPLVSALGREWSHLLDQSVARVEHCMEQITAEQCWMPPGSEQNSIGTIIRHMSGNLNQWGVDGILQQPNSRDRNAEFHSEQRQSHAELMTLLGDAAESAKNVLRRITDADLLESRNIQQFDVTVLGAIMHTVPHFVGHTHQIVQLTRIHLGEQYRFHWDPMGPRVGVPL